VEDAAVAVAVASSVVERDAVVAAVNSVAARDVVVAKVVASSVDAAAVVKDEDVARPVVVEAAAALSPAPTSPTPAPSPAWAHRLHQHQRLLRPENRTYPAAFLLPTVSC
jgi:hypothetical protein